MNGLRPASLLKGAWIKPHDADTENSSMNHIGNCPTVHIHHIVQPGSELGG